MTTQVNISRKSVHFWIYYACLCILVISLPASRFFITLSLIILVCNWLAEGNFHERFHKYLTNRAAVAFSLMYVLNVLGLIWTKDFSFAINNDLLHKLPMLFMPVIISTSPAPDIKRIRLLLLLFILSVVAVSFTGLSIRILQSNVDFREASPFIPNVYFSMMLILAAFQLPLVIKQISNNKTLFLLSLVVSAWLIFFLFYLRSLSGIASFTGVLFLAMVFLIYSQKNTFIIISFLSFFILLFGFAAWLILNTYRLTHFEVETDPVTLPEYTNQGNQYFHDTTEILRENGHLVYLYIADDELNQSWKEVSERDFYGNDLSHHSLRHTLYRYMSSKGLRKDKQGFQKLTDKDIRAVEKGVTNHLYIKRPGFYIRLHQMMMGLYIYTKTSYKNPEWSTLTERFDLWRASWEAFQKHPFLGWGTGSILHAVEYGLEKKDSVLKGKNMKPHNQYLYVMLTLGLFGLIIYLLLYSYLITITGAYKIFMFKVFILIFLINFLGNNSLESQPGQNLFVFFSLFYCFLYPHQRINPVWSKDSSSG